MHIGQRVAIAGMVVSGSLAIVKVLVGVSGHSTAVVADGLESAGDVFASGFVLLGLTLAARPADENHPYGHGRVEILTGLLIGLAVTAACALISYDSLRRLGQPRLPLAAYVVWPLIASLLARMALASVKFHYGRKLHSTALTADAWHDTMDTVSAVAALIAVGLTLSDPARFFNADRYGGFVVGLIVVSVGVRVARETALQLMECFARKTGLRYHVDLHLEVDPEMSVRQSHEIANNVRFRIREQLDWVADVLVHVEPAP
jgi:cation diffusion facilitator family transporter